MGSQRSCGGCRQVVFIDAPNINRQVAVSVRRIEDVPELRVPDNFRWLVRRPGVHLLRERLVEARHDDEELELPGAEVGVCQAPEWTLLRDRVHDGPRERKEEHRRPLELELLEPAAESSRALFDPAGIDPSLDVDDLVVPRVRDAEHQSVAAAKRRDDHGVAETDRRCRPREPREQQSGDQRLAHERHQRLDDHDHVRRESDRADLAVSDRREGLDAEEKGAPPGATHVARRRTHERVGAAQGECRGEDDIERKIPDDHRDDEPRPTHAERRVIGTLRLEPPESDAADVEAAVLVEESRRAVRRDDGAKAEVALVLHGGRSRAWLGTFERGHATKYARARAIC